MIELIPEMSIFLNNSFGGISTETCVYQDGIVFIGIATYDLNELRMEYTTVPSSHQVS